MINTICEKREIIQKYISLHTTGTLSLRGDVYFLVTGGGSERQSLVSLRA